ncbi:MAG: M20/M25/M40 family metallo-hydrolase [Planctomycetaceae bacterium]|nr:M20/M25/M40 family metallo-hydrolase [Planctomycetaceae bacterium]
MPARIAKRKSAPAQDSDLELLMELMAISGKSGEEAEVARYVTDRLVEAGAKPNWIRHDQAHRATPIDGGTGNLVLKLPGNRRPRRMLVSHLDTVPICVGSQPVRRGNRIRSADPKTGLGADNRAGCAVTLLTALKLLREPRPHPPLTFLWTVQEEIGLHGARQANLKLLGNPQLAFNWDGGSASKLTIGATGGYRMEILVRGIASHAGGAPEQGVSAIAIASLAIADLHQQGWHGLIEKSGKVGTSNVGVVRGGAATNVVSDEVFVRAEARSHDSRFRERIVRQIEKAFQHAVKQVRNAAGKKGSVEFDGRLDYDSFCLDPKEPCVLAAKTAIESLGETAELVIANGGLDANWLSARGIPTVSLGCGQLNQHMVSEALDVRQFRRACKIAESLALGEQA